MAAALGVVVGYSANFMNAVCDDDSGRLLLHNGYHRACALLELGVTHAPCVVQTVTSRDELDLVAKPLVANDPGYFFNGRGNDRLRVNRARRGAQRPPRAGRPPIADCAPAARTVLTAAGA